MRSVVVLPQPDGPTSIMVSPSATSRLSESTAGAAPGVNCFVTSTRRIMAGEVPEPGIRAGYRWSSRPTGHRARRNPATACDVRNELRGAASGRSSAMTLQPMLAANTDRWLWWDWVGRNTDLIRHDARGSTSS